VPHIQGAQRDHLRQVFRDGQARGLRADVFAKLGDSISESQAFLSGLACDKPAYGGYSFLRSTVARFNRDRLPDDYTAVWCSRATSFSRASAAAQTGWTAEDVLGEPREPVANRCRSQESALDCEYRLVRPAFALVMLGTNDLERLGDRARYARDLREIVRRSLAADVIPVLSTIPPRHDRERLARRVSGYNATVARVAASERVPLWNYWRSLHSTGIVNGGLADDGIHPNVYVSYDCDPFCRPLDFTKAGLRYGYNQRNLGALLVLRELRRSISG
jgi:hypothetical protein